jgi:transcriptional regulator with XRE-family HTH domain
VETPTFGECLTELCEKHGWSAEQLAKAMDVDRSLIYRWRRNERAPKLDSPYLAQIAALLELSPEEETFLEDARLRTLREFGEIRQRADGERGKDAVERFLGYATRQPLHITPPPRIHSEPPAAGAVQGRGEAIDAAIQLLDATPDAPAEGGEIISVLSQEYLAQDASGNDRLRRWQRAVRGAMQRGWTVRALWWLDRDSQHSIQLVERLLDLVGTGRYFPQYFRRHGHPRLPYDAFVVPGVGAFMSFCAQTPDAPDSALILRDTGQVEVLHQHLLLLASTTEPLVRTYLPDDTVDRWKALLRWEERMRGRLLMRGDLAFNTEPESWARVESAWARSRRASPEDVRQIVELRRQRVALFREHVAYYDYWDICPMRAVRHRLELGTPLRDTEPLSTFWLSPAERVEHIRHLITLLRTYERYQLALLDEEEERQLGVREETQWAATGAGEAMVTVRALNAEGKPHDLDLLITEPTFAPAFRQHYLELWERIKPEHRDREHVITWLEWQIESASDRA